HLSGTGCGDLGDILFAPTIGEIVLASSSSIDEPAYAAPFSHKNETAAPGYYAVKLDRDGGISVDLTATKRVGVHRYLFPESKKANIIVDLCHGIGDKPID